jgi:hypothetical protein
MLTKIDRNNLPAPLASSSLLTTGLQSIVRNQALRTVFFSIGMVLGAVLGAWFVGELPSLFSSIPSLNVTETGVLWGLIWLTRLAGIALGAQVGHMFFRHIAYTVVAKSLLVLREHPEATVEEKAWVTFELAAMYSTLYDSSAWADQSTFLLRNVKAVVVVWCLGMSYFAINISREAITPLYAVQLLTFAIIFASCWQHVYRSPAVMSKLDKDAARQSLHDLLPNEYATSMLQPTLKHAHGHNIWVVLGTMLVIFFLGGLTTVIRADHRQRTQAVESVAQIQGLAAKLLKAPSDQKQAYAVKLHATQYADARLQWATYNNLLEATARNTPFSEQSCSLVSPMKAAVVCSRFGKDATRAMASALHENLTEKIWQMFNGAWYPSRLNPSEEIPPLVKSDVD